MYRKQLQIIKNKILILANYLNCNAFIITTKLRGREAYRQLPFTKCWASYITGSENNIASILPP